MYRGLPRSSILSIASAGQDDRQGDLPHLRGLEVERAQVDPAVRALHRGADDVDHGQGAQEAAPDRPRPARQPVQIDPRRHHHQDDAHDREEDLAVHVEVRVARDVVLGGLADHEHAERADRRDRRTAGSSRGRRSPTAAARRCPRRAVGAMVCHRLSTVGWPHRSPSKPRFAPIVRHTTGAAALAPVPPRSMTTATTMLGSSYGRVADEPRVVLAPVARLGGAGLAGHLRVVGEVREHAGGGAVGAVRRQVEPLADLLEARRCSPAASAGPPTTAAPRGRWGPGRSRATVGVTTVPPFAIAA